MMTEKPHNLIATLICAVALVLGVYPANAQDRGLAVEGGQSLDGKGNLWAVVIGVSQYKNLPDDKQLQFADRDAQAFAEFLRSPQGGGFPATHVKTLINQNATLSALRTALGTWLARSAEADDVVYIFFAGHGVVEGEHDGYLVAHDSDPQNLYATALSVAELDRVITERLKSRTVVLIADACHSGNIGWASRATTEQVLIGRYLDEVGKSGRGVFKLLGSRADENSYEDKRWGGGHGVFTHYLLEGLRGKADIDKDGFVRATEVLDYLSRVVPEETKSLQHPRSAGNVDPRLPLAAIPAVPTHTSTATGSQPAVSNNSKSAALEVRGVPGAEVYINNTYRGRIRPNGVLVVEGLSLGRQEVSIDPPGAAGSLTQSVALTSPRTILNMSAAAGASSNVANNASSTANTNTSVKSSPLVADIKQALSRKLVLEPSGAWSLYEKMVKDSPREPQRNDIEVELSAALEEIGQQAINDYVRLPLSSLKPDSFTRAAAAFGLLQTLRPNDAQLAERRLFCEGRALLMQGRIDEAISRLQRAYQLNPRAAYTLNAIGLTYEVTRDYGKALEAFKTAANLAPHWALPRAHIGNVYLLTGKLNECEAELQRAIELDPSNPDPRLILGNLYIHKNKFDRAEPELRRVLVANPKSADARFLMAYIYRRQGKMFEAERELIEVVNLNPKYAGAYQELGIIYEAGKQYANAADAFESYLRLEPNSPYRDDISKRISKNRELAGKKAPTLKRN